MTLGCSTAEIITNDRNGYLEVGDSALWAEKIIEIISNKEKLLQTKELAYKEVYKTWDDVVDEIRKFYEFAIDDYDSKKNNKKKR